MAKKKAKKKGAKRKSSKRSTSRKSGGKRRSTKRRSSGSTAVVAVKRSKKKTKRKLPAALKRPVQPDRKLASLVGSKKVQRSEIIKKLWVYFKRHKLNKGRTITLDSKLKSSGIWGNKSKIKMTEVGKALKHAK